MKSKIIILILTFGISICNAQDIQTLLKRVAPGILSDTIGYANTNFGYSTSIDGDVLVVGANFEPSSYDGCDSTTNAGAAYVFYRNSGGTDNWDFVKMLTGGYAGYRSRRENDEFGFSVSVSGDIIVVGAPEQDFDSVGDNSPKIGAGAAYVFSKNYGGTDNWGFVKKIVGKGTNGRIGNDNFGVSVGVSGDIIVVGANNQDYDSAGSNLLSSAGAAYIFNKNSGGTDNWGVVKKLTGKGTNGRNADDEFGISVAIDDELIVIGALGQDYDSLGNNLRSSSGAAYVFNKNSGGTDNWGLVNKITPSARAGSDQFGISVAIDDELIAIGAHQHSFDSANLNSVSDAGAAYVFNKNSGGTDNWGLVKKLTGKGTNGRNINDYFGASIAISNDIVVVGTKEQDYDSAGNNSITGAGAALVFQKNYGGTDNWGLVKKLTGKGTNGRGTDDKFGSGVAISGDIIVSGAIGHDYNSANEHRVNMGTAFISYKNSGGTDNWGFVKKVSQRTYYGRSANNGFGNEVAISGDVMVIAAPGDDYDTSSNNFLTSAGAVYVFHRNNGGTDNWGFVKKLTGNGTNGRVSNDQFGGAIAVEGDVIVIGASSQDYDSTGDNFASAAGAAFVFHRNTGGTDNWGFVKKLTGKGTNGRIAIDRFGGSVAISNSTIVIGASLQDYDSAGGNSITDAGAAYVFQRNSGGTDNWGFVKKLTGKGTNGRVADDWFGSTVSIFNDIIAINSDLQDYDSAGNNFSTNAGATFVFYKNSGGTDNWGFVKKLTGKGTNGRNSNDRFGSSIAISENTIIVGATSHGYDSAGGNFTIATGAAYIFYKNSGGVDNWGFVKKLTGKGTNGRVSYDRFGGKVSIAGDIIIVGAAGHDYDTLGGNFISSTGAAYIYAQHSGGVDNWGFIKKITGEGTNGRNNLDNFGESVAISGNIVVVGARSQSYDSAGANFANRTGAVWMMTDNNALIYNGSAWSPQAPSSSTSSYRAFVQSGTATISSGSNINMLTVHSNSTASLAGDFNINNSYTNHGVTSGSGKIVLNGSSTQNIYGNGTTANLELDNSSGANIYDSLNISGILTLTSGALTTDNKLKLAATAATNYGQIAETGTGTISGNITAEFYIAGGGEGYRPICSPVNGATVVDLSDDFELNFGTPDSTYCTIWRFDEETSPYWSPATGTAQSMDTGSFSVYMGGTSSWSNPLPITMDITGSYFGTSNYTVNGLTRTGSITDTSGWHYVRNPWPSGFLWSGITGSSVSVGGAGTIQGEDVFVYDQSGGAYVPFDNNTTGVIPPFHPFCFRITANNTNVTFNNAARSTSSLSNYFDKTSQQNYIELVVTDTSGKKDKVKFYTDAKAENGYDIYDGSKLMNPIAPNLYFMVDGLPSYKQVFKTLPIKNEYIPLNFKTKKGGKYKISFVAENLQGGTKVELEDRLSQTRHDILAGTYEFTHNGNNPLGRFALHFSKKETTSTQEIDAETIYVGSTGNTITVSIANEGVYEIEVFDLLGRSIQAPVKYEGAKGTKTIVVNGIKPGYYLVKIQGASFFKTVKTFLR